MAMATAARTSPSPIVRFVTFGTGNCHLPGFAPVSRRPLLIVLILTSIVAAACGDGSDAAVGSFPPASPAAEGEYRALTGADGTHHPALDPDANEDVDTVTQIRSTGRENVPSALRGDRRDPSFPDALIDLDRILSGGPPPDGIPSLDDPTFQTASTVGWLGAEEAVIALEINGKARAYPVQVMTWHEIVNDTIGDIPVTVAYCPLCNSALAYDRRLGDRILDFGTSGELFNSSLVMYDRQTESLWTHFDGQAVVGHLSGERLTTFSIQTVSWERWVEANPDGLVLSRITGFSRDYGRNPYRGYDNPDDRPFLYDGDYDARLEPKDRVIAVRDPDQPAVVLKLEDVFSSGTVAFEAHGRSLIAVVEPGLGSPLDSDQVAQGRDQGSSAVFVAELDGSPVDLVRTEEGFHDTTSGIVFDIFGSALDGSGARLEQVEHLDTFWFAIAAFEPDAEILPPTDGREQNDS